ncbi:hypothetical protein JTB14_004948 [Gonioctena quinquepunctata]|nr:hypothetical protein JTB14_004948 [Gonioctena quinquepunctata]
MKRRNLEDYKESVVKVMWNSTAKQLQEMNELVRRMDNSIESWDVLLAFVCSFSSFMVSLDDYILSERVIVIFE